MPIKVYPVPWELMKKANYKKLSGGSTMKKAGILSVLMVLALATVAMAAVALGSLFHFVMTGPNEVSKELEDELEKEEK